MCVTEASFADLELDSQQKTEIHAPRLTIVHRAQDLSWYRVRQVTILSLPQTRYTRGVRSVLGMTVQIPRTVLSSV